MFEINVWLGNVLKEYPYITFLFLILYSFLYLIFRLDKLKRALSIEPKLSKLMKLQKMIEDKDKKLMDFMDLQIKTELFKECTGYFNTTTIKRVVDFYISNSDKYSWREIKLIIFRFELKEDQLKLKPRDRFTRVLELLGYFYYGLFALISILMAYFLLIFKIHLFGIIPLVVVLDLSVWMILREGDKVRIYKKMLLEPSFKDKVRTKHKVDLQ